MSMKKKSSQQQSKWYVKDMAFQQQSQIDANRTNDMMIEWLNYERRKLAFTIQ